MLDITLYPDEVLKRKTEDIAEITPDVGQLIDDMFKTMYANEGIGLAAPQVGKSLNLTVIDLSLGEDPEQKLVLINPDIIETIGEQFEEEGCLSFPGIIAPVKRPAYVKVRAMGRDGEVFKIEGEGMLARALSHEIDHLEGVVFIDHIKGLEKSLILKRIRKLQKENLWRRAS